MTLKEASTLRIGDKVIAVNGRYTQHARVTLIEPHQREGFWITFEWTNPKGKVCTGRKTHVSVYWPDDNK